MTCLDSSSPTPSLPSPPFPSKAFSCWHYRFVKVLHPSPSSPSSPLSFIPLPLDAANPKAFSCWHTHCLINSFCRIIAPSKVIFSLHSIPFPLRSC